MPESDENRVKKAAALAYEKGIKDAVVLARLDDHDRHLTDLNGMAPTLREVCNRLNEIEKRETARDAVATATKAAVDEHGKKQVSSRQFAFGAVSMIVAVGGLFVAAAPPG